MVALMSIVIGVLAPHLHSVPGMRLVLWRLTRMVVPGLFGVVALGGTANPREIVLTTTGNGR
jgi:hypothetical protein